MGEMEENHSEISGAGPDGCPEFSGSEGGDRPERGPAGNPALSSYLIIQLNEERYLVSMEIVHRIIKPLEIFPMPDMPDFVLGVANCYGDVLPVVNLKRVLRLPDMSGDVHRKFIICRFRQMKVGFVVDDALDVWEIEAGQVQTDTARTRENEYITGEVIRGSDTLTLIDLAKLIVSHQAVT
jgi:chemotaxis signal transduction protein